MLKILEMSQPCDSHLEWDTSGAILTAESLKPEELQDFAMAYKAEKCFFKNPKNDKIEIVRATFEEYQISKEALKLNNQCPCKQIPCHAFLKTLTNIFCIEFLFFQEPGLARIIQTSKIYPALLGCIRMALPKTPLYFTTTALSSMAINNFGGIYETAH